jgi:dGTPase
MALGHDIGHTPFGHAGERFLNNFYHERTGRYFMHNVQSVRVLDVLYGRNLSLQTLDGVICHNGEFEQQRFQMSGLNDFPEFDTMVEDCWQNGSAATKHLRPATLEGCVVRISDIIAYVGKDRQDAIIAHIAQEDTFDDGLGSAYNTWALSAFITDVVANSFGKDQICMSEAAFEELRRAKRENYQKIYLSSEVNGEFSHEISELFGLLYEHELETLKAGNEDSAIFRHHIKPVSTQLANYGRTYDWQDDHDLTVVDFISSMTDEYFMGICQRLFPKQASVFPSHGYFDGLDG